MDLKDSGEHLVAHEILEREVVGIHKTLNRSMDVITDSIEETRMKMRSMSEDLAVVRERLNHVASDSDVSQAISICRASHEKKPVNWKGITALITGIIAAIAAATVLVIQAL